MSHPLLTIPFRISGYMGQYIYAQVYKHWPSKYTSYNSYFAHPIQLYRKAYIIIPYIARNFRGVKNHST